MNSKNKAKHANQEPGQMPMALRTFLEFTPDRFAQEYWDWLDSNSRAAEEMIEVLITSHPKLAALCVPDAGKAIARS